MSVKFTAKNRSFLIKMMKMFSNHLDLYSTAYFSFFLFRNIQVKEGNGSSLLLIVIS